MDPYETLGVPRTADQATIKRAGKRKKVASHPDHGGDRKKYEAASRALVVLTDPLRKHHFDTTGEADFEPVDPHRQAVTDIIMPVLDMAINEALAHPGDHKFDVERMADLIERVRFIIQKQIDASLAAKAKTLTQADKIERVAVREHGPTDAEGSTMSTSYPYLTLSRRLGVRYGDLLKIVDYLDGGYGTSYYGVPALLNLNRKWRDPLTTDDVDEICEIWAREQKRRRVLSVS